MHVIMIFCVTQGATSSLKAKVCKDKEILNTDPKLDRL